jgi:hypothetical protein
VSLSIGMAEIPGLAGARGPGKSTLGHGVTMLFITHDLPLLVTLRVAWALAEVELDESHLERLPFKLSGGQRRPVAIARAAGGDSPLAKGGMVLPLAFGIRGWTAMGQEGGALHGRWRALCCLSDATSMLRRDPDFRGRLLPDERDRVVAGLSQSGYLPPRTPAEQGR